MMREYRTAVLAGLAALAVAGLSLAAIRDTKTVKIALPDGSIARIEYSGDTAPNVTVAPVSHRAPAGLVGGFDHTSFAALDPVAAEMDQQAAAMIRQAAQLEALPVLIQGNLGTQALGKLPAGTVHYEAVSTTSGNGTCTRSVEMTSYGADQKLRIASAKWGDCKLLDRTREPVRLETPVHPPVQDPAKPQTADVADRARGDIV
jgi:hypothetical protein